MSMPLKSVLALVFLQVIPVCLLITIAGGLTYYSLEHLLGFDVNANIISMIFVIIGAGYLGRVIKQANKNGQ